MIARLFIAILLEVCLCAGGTAIAQETVSFPSLDVTLTDGAPTMLRALLFRPPGAGPFPAIVAFHGCSGLFDKQGQLVKREASWSQLFASRGYVVLLPDSFGPRGVTTDCQGLIRPWLERSYDAYGALRYLQSQRFVDGKRIGLIGWSHGGATVMFTIAADNPARPPELPQGDFRAAVAFYPAWCLRLGPKWSSNIPVLLEIGALDDSIFPGPCVDRVQSAIDQGMPDQIKVYDDAFHDFDWPDDAMHVVTSPSGKAVHYGVNGEARADASVRAPAFLDSRLKP